MPSHHVPLTPNFKVAPYVVFFVAAPAFATHGPRNMTEGGTRKHLHELYLSFANQWWHVTERVRARVCADMRFEIWGAGA